MTNRNPESQGREERAGLEAIEPFSENGVGVPLTRWWTEQNPPESKEEAVGFGVVVPDETVPPVDEPVLLGASAVTRSTSWSH